MQPALNALFPTGSDVNVEDGEGKDREGRVDNVSGVNVLVGKCRGVESRANDIVPIFVVAVVARVDVGSSESSVGVGGTVRESGIVKKTSEGDEDGGVDGGDKSIVNSASVLVVVRAVRERGIGEEKSVGVRVANGRLTGIVNMNSDVVEVADGVLIGGVLGHTGI
jgi:hypothetical protein